MIYDIEILLSTIKQNNNDYIKAINIKEDAVIINQNINNTFKRMNNNIKVIEMDRKGVGLSRNIALLNSSLDIIVFADDDLVFLDDYKKIISDAYTKYPKADGILFNFRNNNSYYKIKKDYRIRWYNYMRFGAARFTFKRKSVIQSRVLFSLEHGGGTNIGSGEDTLFLKDMLKRGMKLYAVNSSYAEMTEDRESTWFEGFNEKYFIDKGMLFYDISPTFYRFLNLRFAFKNKSKEINFFDKIRLLNKGAKKRRRLKNG